MISCALGSSPGRKGEFPYISHLFFDNPYPLNSAFHQCRSDRYDLSGSGCAIWGNAHRLFAFSDVHHRSHHYWGYCLESLYLGGVEADGGDKSGGLYCAAVAWRLPLMSLAASPTCTATALLTLTSSLAMSSSPGQIQICCARIRLGSSS